MWNAVSSFEVDACCEHSRGNGLDESLELMHSIFERRRTSVNGENDVSMKLRGLVV